MPRKAQYRLFQDKQKLIELLGFDTKEAYEQWTKTDRLFLTFWKDFREQWLLPQREKAREGNKKKRSKDATLEEVRRQIVCGEANGRRRYSRDHQHTDPEKEGWTGKDWLAWLLSHLVTSNTNDLDGLFYRKNLTLEERERQMWQVIQRFLADTSDSRKTRSGTRAEALQLLSRPLRHRHRRYNYSTDQTRNQVTVRWWCRGVLEACAERIKEYSPTLRGS
ncbi:hypothetical protein MPH_07806 [Macrophomina phaseolina MS6]|uniref:Uncharacterized protein n=1 Tax=Macrophomina phaseolina (strain MS6) TaxID=1126212 RepID=K2RQK0_MACPH|nr:hypothetical protein MPH_07806 [Macrophomina phaseolina MS6]